MVDPNDHPIELVESRHEQWRRLYRAERARLRTALEARDLLDAVERIEHVGSTAVPDLAAKDVVDVDVVVADDAVDAVATAITEDLGGDRYRNSEEWHPVFRRAGDGGQYFNVHVFARSGDGWRVSVATREALRADADLCERYERRKRDLAADTDDLHEYSVGKTDLIREAVALVRGGDEPAVDFDVPSPGTVGPDDG